MRLKRKYGVIFYSIPTLVCTVLLILEINYANNKVDVASVSYNESSDISYKVYLKENSYYETPYLDEKSSYIASLIDNFTIDYKYLNTFSADIDYTLKYGVTADLVVFDSSNDKKPIYTKKYTLADEQEIKGFGKMAKADLLNQVINYDEYNEIINELKREIVPNANLKINFNTKFVGKNKAIGKDIISNKTSTLDIPISQKTIDANLKKNNTSSNQTVTNKKSLSVPLIALLVGTILLLLLTLIYYVLYIIKTAEKKTKYEQKLNKILREFDRAITEAKGKLRLDRNANTIEIKDFMELLDVHDNFNIPIIYYRISSTKSVFIVKNGNDIYYNVMKSDDYE
ncbi:MAG: hypothetical protein E7158_04025 [Firmicutes bacterium]|nr:hypothetical protein [Bacillota bacterium]